jgi:uncharacterized protein
MAGSSATLHESTDKLRIETVDRHRAIISIIEELEAIDWYDQRVDATEDEELRAILKHNRDEEKEHATMIFEWLRRKDPIFDQNFKKYLFSTGDIASLEDAEPNASIDSPGNESLNIGSLAGGEHE